jgi:hypothetical protein
MINDFLDGQKTIGGMEFRPFTLGSKAACEQMGLTMFTTGQLCDDPGEAEQQLIAFAWIHVKPLGEVLKALRNGTATDDARAFGFEIPIGAVSEMISEINRISDQAKANAVEVVDRPAHGKSDAPKNSVGQT